MNKNYQFGLLYFIHLLISADGIADRNEIDALCKIKIRENISDDAFQEFEETKKTQTEREIYQSGMDHLTKCTDLEKLKVFATLYRLSEVDGRVHTKEIRLLLYSIKTAGIEFNEVVEFARTNPLIF